MLLQQGTMLGKRYEVMEKIGAGGMAIVYKAKDKKLERFVTVKVLREEFVADEEFVKRFRVEAQSAASLNHSNIVSVFDVGQEGSTYYIVMEYIKGETLKEFITRKTPLDNDTIIAMSMQIASALSHAHSNHIIHRDIKPQNILVTSDGFIKVTDFGIARAATSKTVSMTGSAIGSVHYFSPEQARGSFADEKSDIYSFGIVMYEMVTGRLPFDGDSHVTVALKQIHDEVPVIAAYAANVSKSLKLIIEKCVQKKSVDRYQDAMDIYRDLKKALTDNSGTFVKKKDYKGYNTIELSEKDIKKIRDESKNKPAMKIDDIESMYLNTDLDDLNENLRPAPIPKQIQEPTTKKTKPHPDILQEDEEEELDMEDATKDKLVVIGAIALSLVIISVIVYFGAKFLFPPKEEPQTESNISSEAPEQNGGFVIVPDVVGDTYDEASLEMMALGVTLEKVEKSYEDIPEGEITWQELTAGGSIPPSITTMKVYVSVGPKKYPMPNLILNLEDDAVEAINQAIPNANIDIQYDYSDDTVFGAVYAQLPEGGTELVPGSQVTIYVSLGVKVDKVKVPNTRGLTEAEAVKQLEALKFVVGTPTFVESATVAEGLVVSQTLEAGTEVNERSRISLAISKGKAPQQNTEPSKIVDSPNTSGTTNVTEPPKTTETNPPANWEQPPKDQSTPKKEKKSFTLNPINLSEDATTVLVKLLMTTGVDEHVVYEKEVERASLPVSVEVEASGTVNLKLFMNDILQWSENVSFTEGE